MSERKTSRGPTWQKLVDVRNILAPLCEENKGKGFFGRTWGKRTMEMFLKEAISPSQTDRKL